MRKSFGPKAQSTEPIDTKRVLKDVASDQSFIFAERDVVGIVGSSEVNIISDPEANYINGKLSIAALPQDIHVGAMWTLNPMLVSTVPSTMSTPISTFVYNPPGKAFMEGLQKNLEVIASFQ